MLIIFGLSFVSDAKGHKRALSNLAENLTTGQMGNSSVDLFPALWKIPEA